MGKTKERENILTRFGTAMGDFSMKYMPDAATFAVIFTIIAFVGGILLAKQAPMEMVGHWYNGFWSLLGFSMQIALGICVNAIGPGYYFTEMTEPLLKDPAVVQKYEEKIPMARLGLPADLATTAVYLASDASSYVTGQIVCVDGGWLIDRPVVPCRAADAAASQCR